MPERILGVDVGTTSARALVLDGDGRVYGSGSAKLDSLHPQPGRAEQDPVALWKRVQAVIAEALSSASCNPEELAAVGVAAQRSSVIVWERSSGEPLFPMVLWNDLRGAARALELQAAGHLALPIAAVSKLEAVIDAIPRGRERARAGELAWGTLDSFLVHRLSGGTLHVSDYSNAWSTGYLDLATRRTWNQALIEFQDLPLSLFPTLCDTYGEIGRTAAASIGAEVPVCAIVADQQSGMFAHGAWEPGQWKATYGTSATLMVSTGDTPRLEGGLTPMLQFAREANTRFAVEGMVISAGALLDWLVDGLGLADSVEDLIQEAAGLADAGGVALLPALQGLGAPHNDAERRAAIVGLRAASGPAQIARAALEGIAFRMREVVEQVEAMEGVEVPALLPVDGGLAASDAFLQIQADLLARPLRRPRETESTAIGAGLAAALGCGRLRAEDLALAGGEGQSFEPAIPASEAARRFEAWRDRVSAPR